MPSSLRLASTGLGRADAVAVALFENTRTLPSGYRKLDDCLGGALSAALKRPEFSTARHAITTLVPDKGAKRLLVIGLGDRGKLTADVLRVGAANVLKAVGKARLGSVDIDVLPGLGDALPAEAVGRAVGDGLAIADFKFDTYKGAAQAKNNSVKPTAVQAVLPAALRKAAQRALTVGQGVNLARTLAATPANVANPKYIAQQARAMAKRAGLRCGVLEEKQLEKLGMGGLLAVGAGGSTDPVLITLEHRPPRTPGNSRPILLVGKAITFDTGGYSIKPGDSMVTMKYDKCGGMAVLGAMLAVALLKLPVHVVGLVPTAENMIDEDAYRPGDIIRFFNGVTAEITNTDAEGRLVLADALAYGSKTYNPRAVIDLATLTGGVVVGLGSFHAGCFCNDDRLCAQLLDAGQDTGERLWRLPLGDEHRNMMKGTHSDIVNSAGREAHPAQGAAFLSYFVDKDSPTKLPTTPWAHLDIAGVADVRNDTPLFPKGPTGFGVRLLVRALEGMR